MNAICQVLVPFSENEDNTIKTYPEGEVFEAEQKWAENYERIGFVKILKKAKAEQIETADKPAVAEKAAKRVKK